ncbi:hypothetical protein OJ997_06900 [Solirubrobacter phytolaccae]|uniref:Uncharacterized protein n=1 Tax=Solirubrobacter phytolaccae TaxID=1404360 RepID=A0A9X3SE45_9ACTN|nr:hypothetical protein [Solirubrobacter phytolaccae]MDA0180017.1 hypothetical protein [Solirubrobacter phytolaccae]
MNTAIRFANTDDTSGLERLAQLDSSVVPAAPILLAEEGGQLIAAISARNGTAIADPFTRSANAVELLRTRARQLGAGESRPHRAINSLRLQLR